MTNFVCQVQSIHTHAISLEYFLVPWDTEILGQPVAEISRLEVTDPERAARDYVAFERWCAGQEVTLCSCRLAQERLTESLL